MDIDMHARLEPGFTLNGAHWNDGRGTVGPLEPKEGRAADPAERTVDVPTLAIRVDLILALRDDELIALDDHERRDGGACPAAAAPTVAVEGHLGLTADFVGDRSTEAASPNLGHGWILRARTATRSQAWR